MEKQTAIQKINPEKYGLKMEQVKEIDKAFEPKIAERQGFVKVYENILTQEITPKLCKDASDLRKKLVKVRTGIVAIHKTQKSFFLAAGKYVDAWKNKETLPVTQMEENLRQIEEHYERIEAEKIQRLQEDRAKMLKPFNMDVIPDNLGKMKEEEWGYFLSGVKSSYEKKKEEERRIEEEKIREENERLQKELKAKEDEERKRIEEENEKKEVERKKGDQEKAQDLMDSLSDIKMKYSFESERYMKMQDGVVNMLDKVIDYIGKYVD